MYNLRQVQLSNTISRLLNLIIFKLHLEIKLAKASQKYEKQIT